MLRDQNQDMTFEEVMMKFVEAKDSGPRSATKLLHDLGANAMRSGSYRAQPRLQHQTTHPSASSNTRGPGTPGSTINDKLCSLMVDPLTPSALWQATTKDHDNPNTLLQLNLLVYCPLTP